MSFEDEVIALFSRAHRLPRRRGRSPIIGIGDDCALIPSKRGRFWCITVDSQEEGIHFFPGTKPEDIGWKLVMASASDLAAKGARPLYAFLNLALPQKTQIRWVKRFERGLTRALKSCDLTLLGGNTTASVKGMHASLTAIGETTRVKLRSDARAGDALVVIGPIGEADLGLRGVSRFAKSLLRPQALLREGAWLARQKSVHAMMDVSDGLWIDANRMAKASGFSVAFHKPELWLSREAIRACRKFGYDPRKIALFGGEDYSLLIAIDPRQAERVASRFRKNFQARWTEVGALTGQADSRREPHGRAFDHFKA